MIALSPLSRSWQKTTCSCSVSSSSDGNAVTVATFLCTSQLVVASFVLFGEVPHGWRGSHSPRLEGGGARDETRHVRGPRTAIARSRQQDEPAYRRSREPAPAVRGCRPVPRGPEDGHSLGQGRQDRVDPHSRGA